MSIFLINCLSIFCFYLKVTYHSISYTPYQTQTHYHLQGLCGGSVESCAMLGNCHRCDLSAVTLNAQNPAPGFTEYVVTYRAPAYRVRLHLVVLRFIILAPKLRTRLPGPII